jgi:small ligand-binding sensory domain FIST
MEWTSAMSTLANTADALSECVSGVRAGTKSGLDPNLIVVFSSPDHDAPTLSLGADIRRHFPGATVVGCSGAGVIGDGLEVEDAPGLSLTAAVLPGVTLCAFHLPGSSVPSPDAPPDAWAAAVGVTADVGPHFILLADPFSTDIDALLSGMDFAFPAAAKIGGLASGGNRPGAHALYLDDQVLREGAVGVALSGNVVVDTVVAQGCRPVGEAMHITSAERNLVLTVDDEPALDALQRLFERMSPSDQALAQRSLFLGIAMDPLQERAGAGDFLIRNVVGIDPRSKAVAVGAYLQEGQLVQFHVRDADTSADDLRAALAGYRSDAGDRSAAGALLFQCTGRGQYLYGRAGHDADMFGEMIGSLPLGGFFCNGEIGPVGGTTYLHSYTSSFGIFRPRTAID